MTSIGTKLYTWRYGELVGEDGFGNKYYTEKAPRDAARAKRWVVFADGASVEASAVPPEWHAWLHRYTNEAPKADDHRWTWQKPHRPNPTGTAAAYRPPGHDLAGGKRAAATGDYEAWTPGD
jgi:NADH:ubiquinone oxidoreductase subunit